MANKKTAETNATATFEMKNKSNLMSLHDLIAYAHDELMNRRALSESDFSDKGLPKQEFDQWTAYVEELRQQVIEYNTVAQSRVATDKAIENAKGHVWVAWRDVLKKGAEEEYCKNFFVRENDVHLMSEWAGLTAVSTVRGKVWGNASKTNFRRNVETAIGIRMAGNAMLSDDDRDLITAYEGAQKTVKSMTDALNDRVENGKTINGLYTALRGAEKGLEEMQNLVATLNIDDKSKEKLLEKSKFAVTMAKDKVTDAEKKLKNAQDTISEKQKDYDKLIGTLKSVGDNK